MSKANLQPTAMCRKSNLSQAFEQSGSSANVRKQEEELLSVCVLVIVGRGEVTAGPHGTAAVALRLTTLCAFPLGRVLASRSAVALKENWL